MRVRAWVLGLASMGLVAAAPMAAADAAPHAYPVKIRATISVSTNVPLVHATIIVSGSHFHANALVRLVLHTKAYAMGSVQTTADGTFSTSVQLPAGVTGTHTLIATTGADNQPSQVLHISAAGQNGSTGTTGTTGNGGGTALTGVDIAGLVGLGLVLVVSGTVLAGRGRRKATVRV